MTGLALFAILPLGLASFFSRRELRRGTCMGIVPLVAAGLAGGAAKLLGGLFGGRGQAKAAQAAADNANAENTWKAKLSGATYGTERMPYYKQGSKMRGWRDAFMRGVMRNKNNGLSKLFGGWDEGKGTAFNAGQDVASVSNPYDVAGAPPKLKAVSGGWQSTLGGALSGAGAGVLEGANIYNTLKKP